MPEDNEQAIHILVTLPISESHLEGLREISPRLEISVHPTRQAGEIPEEVWERTEILFTHNTLPEPEAAPNLRWIQFFLAGVERQIAAPIFANQDLTATTMSGANASQVAEHAVALLLALAHRLPDMLRQQKRTNWPANKNERFLPMELRGSTVGIVGYGSIGRQVARLLKPFGATILATKRDLSHLGDEGYQPEGMGDAEGTLPRRLYPGKALRSMFKDCDFVVVTAPLTEETQGMIGAEQLAALEPHALFVDVSRGGVVDHEALLAALGEGRLGGAALDVFPEEPLPADSPLWEMANVIVSPHVAGISKHYNRRAVELFGANLERYLAGEELYNQVDRGEGY